jgi:hypothetical protein
MTAPKWIDPKFTISGLIQIVLLLVSVIGGGVTLFSRVDANDRDITALQRVVTDIPGIKSDVLLLQNTFSNRSTARDVQIGSLTTRVDRIETSVDAKLDEIAKSLASMQSDLAALNATVKAAAARP